MLDEVLADLAAESDDLDAMVAGLSEVDFSRPTPAPGWTIAHQIAHLAWTDEVTLFAINDPDGFLDLLSKEPDVATFVDRAATEGLAPPVELLSRWRTGRAALATALRTAPGRIPWVGTPSMSPTSMATARIMETWAHAQDVADALGRTRQFTPRIRHVAHIGYRTLGHGFAMHGRPVPGTPVRVELSTPDGALWTYGPEDAPDRLVGPAVDFCLLVTQRRHPADLALQASGPVATEWLEVAQAFAGLPGAKREPAGARS
jgi:uncharacterized protein (TIGR03084 family)